MEIKDLYNVTLFEFVPIQLLLCHSLHTDVKFEGQTVYLTCPVQNILELGVRSVNHCAIIYFQNYYT